MPLLQPASLIFPLANAGVPLFTSNLLWQVILLIPIILIELLIHKNILKISLRQSLLISSITNFYSTLVGLIIVIIFGFLLGVIDSSNPPLDDRFNRFIIFRLLGFLIMGVISIGTEYAFGLRFMQGRVEKSIVKKSFLMANISSYLLLTSVMVLSFTMSFLEAQNSIKMIQKNLAEFDRVCPVIIASDGCDQVFSKRVEVYQKLAQIHRKHHSVIQQMDTLKTLSQLNEATAKTCSKNSPRIVCSKVTGKR